MRTIRVLILLVVVCAMVGAAPARMKFEYVRQWGSKGKKSGQFDRPVGIAISGDGYVYVVDQINARVQKFKTDGTFVLAFGEKGHGPGKFILPRGIAVGPDGFVFVADFGDHVVQKFSPEGKLLARFGGEGETAGRLKNPTGVFVDSDGAVYVAEDGNKRVQKFSSDGKFIVRYFAYHMIPTDVVVSGDEVTVSSQPHSIWHYELGSKLKKPEYLYSRLWGPMGITKHDGLLYVACRDGAVRVRTYDGKERGVFGKTGKRDGEFQVAADVAVDKDGLVYVVDKYNHRIQVFKQSN